MHDSSISSRLSVPAVIRGRVDGWVTTVILGLLAIVLGVGCARRVPELPIPPEANNVTPYRIQPGDVIEVRFQYHPNETQKLTIRPDGTLPLGITGDIETTGLTAEELQEVIKQRASRFLRDPVVEITVTDVGARAYVGGEVTTAGYVSLGKPMTVLQAIFERGGFKTTANLEQVVVISRPQGETGEALVRVIDVGATVHDGDPLLGALLSPDDVVFVPKTRIAKANQVVSQWIDGLTPEMLKNIRVSPF
jgi:protein involved in polysaccharide export with SLBB domain